MYGPGAIATSLWGRRKYRRYNVKYPISLRFRSEGSVLEIAGTCNNVSVLGLLLSSPVPIPIDSQVSFTMSLSGETTQRPIKLAGEGRVRRVEPGANPGFAIAVACEHPIAEQCDLASVNDLQET